MTPKLYAKPILREWRESKEWTQQEMADLLGVFMDKTISVNTYIKWEQGKHWLTPDNALELSRFTRINVSDLTERK